jgi:Ca2+-binding EF-hand superfamily protein
MLISSSVMVYTAKENKSIVPMTNVMQNDEHFREIRRQIILTKRKIRLLEWSLLLLIGSCVYPLRVNCYFCPHHHHLFKFRRRKTHVTTPSLVTQEKISRREVYPHQMTASLFEEQQDVSEKKSDTFVEINNVTKNPSSYPYPTIEIEVGDNEFDNTNAMPIPYFATQEAKRTNGVQPKNGAYVNTDFYSRNQPSFYEIHSYFSRKRDDHRALEATTAQSDKAKTVNSTFPTIDKHPVSIKRRSIFARLFRRKNIENMEESDLKPSNTSAFVDSNGLRSIWKHRNARSAEEGIRREKTAISSARQLSSVLAKASGTIERTSRHYAARTLTGLLNALAEEADDLEVEVDARDDTPISSKQIDAVRIKFSRLGFKPLRMGGHDSPGQKLAVAPQLHENFQNLWRRRDDTWQVSHETIDHQYNSHDDMNLSADDAFDRIDVDKSGFLDKEELVQALSLAAISSNNGQMLESDSNLPIIKNLAADLFELYDINGDGVVDRKEYKNMVEDMATLRKAEEWREKRDEKTPNEEKNTDDNNDSWMSIAMRFGQESVNWVTSLIPKPASDASDASASPSEQLTPVEEFNRTHSAVLHEANISSDVSILKDAEKSDNSRSSKMLGSITFSDLKIDLRRLFFGAIPVIKHITPGGPLILEPFTTTITGSFNREDIMNSILLDAGLRRLVMRALRLRVGSLRDFIEGAVFKGRAWKTFGGEGGPKVEIPELTNVEFDENDKLIITGRAKVQTRPGSPVIDQTFKVRTSIGTRKDGRFIRLEEPEIALVIECPRSWERRYDGDILTMILIQNPFSHACP